MRTLRLIPIALAAAAAAASASADGPQPYGVNNETFSPDGKVSYIAVVKRQSTVVQLWRDARRIRSVKLPGGLGFPVVAANGASEGVSRDGSTLVAASYRSGFRVLDAHTLRLLQIVRLPSSFSYDALSPHARTLYLIQHVSSPNWNRYRVRAYDLWRRRLLPKPIFDRRGEWKTVMSGTPVARAIGSDGRWVYTLYTRPGGRPFVHSLDSVHRKAFCVDLPWMRDQNRLFNMELKLTRDELQLRGAGKVFRRIDLRTYRVA